MKKSSLLIAFLFLIRIISSAAYAEETIEYDDGSKLQLDAVNRIYLSQTAVKAEVNAAKNLQKKLHELYGINVSLQRKLRDDEGGTMIMLGRDAVLHADLITPQELESVKRDGYIIRVKNKQIGISGYDVPGTLYGSYRFLREIGLKIYPRHEGSEIEVFTPIEDGSLRQFTLQAKPYFEYRGLFSHQEKGQFGNSISEYSWAQLRFARKYDYLKDGGYIGADHTAGYLVPTGLYLEDHPEYYGKTNGGHKAVTIDTPTMRVALCACKKDVQRISAERMKEWMKIQPKRRYFMVSDGDGENSCDACAATDPIPDYYTDRQLEWANSVARATREEFPENTILTLAYLKTVKPPIDAKLEPNVLVVYAPWYWTSRTTSAVGLAHPLNMLAAEEFLEWTKRFPGQIGLYDYPADWVYGTAERIKYYAGNGVKWIYFNGAKGNLLHWVASQLLWDPSLDTDKLLEEYIRVFYGAASQPMLDYWDLRKYTIKYLSAHNKNPLGQPSFTNKAFQLLKETERLAATTKMELRTRILEGIAEELFTILRYARNEGSRPEKLSNYMRYYITINQQIYKNAEDLNYKKGMLARKQRAFKRKLATLGIKFPQEKANKLLLMNGPVGEAVDEFEEKLEERHALKRKFSSDSERKCTNIQFNSRQEVSKWQDYGKDNNHSTQFVLNSISNVTGRKFTGIQIKADLTQLPVANRGNLKIHAGSVMIHRKFDKPLDITGCRYLDFHLYNTNTVPATIYINGRGGKHSDVILQAGEQITRIDLANFLDRRRNQQEPVQQINSITIELHPQDNFYPYPETKDTLLTLFGLEAKNHDPQPDDLPYKGKAIWMTHFRANIPHGNKATTSLTVGNSKLEIFLKDLKRFIGRSGKERFRSLTAHRTISPVFSILTQDKYDAAQQQTAVALQKELERIFQVTLPVNPPGSSFDNAIVIELDASAENEATKASEMGDLALAARSGRITIRHPADITPQRSFANYLERYERVPLEGENHAEIRDRTDFLHEQF